MRTSHRASIGIAACMAAVLALSAGPSAALADPNTAPAAPQPSIDCNIWWDEPRHDSFSSDYRSVIGPATPGQTIKVRLRAAQSDLNSARVRVWDDRVNSATYYAMAWDSSFDTDPYIYDWWFADIPTGSQPTVLSYFFELNDDPDNNPGNGICDQDFYVDDDSKFYGGGLGAMNDGYDDTRSFQITVYDPNFAVPAWMQRGIAYQVFPDRFRDGTGGNNPIAGRFSYNTSGAIVRSNQSDWNYTVCDPRSTYSPSCDGKYGDNFYGGDLRGIIQKLEDGYFTNLGVSVLYLNPIFRSPSNHKYDTADFMVIDPDFGTLADFQELTAKAEARGIKVILDGVFNHTSSDSKYFDRYSRYDADGNLTSQGVGTDDNSGACEAGSSGFYSWFYFPDIGHPGKDGETFVTCNNKPDPLNAPQTYEAWYGYSSLPKLKANSAPVRQLIWSDETNSVGPYWVSQGADGWRFDVGADVDSGLTNDPTNDYWEGFRTAVRDAGVTGKSDTLMLGEEWSDASAWLLGNEWDSVMNYRFRSALLSWLFTGCSGNGCNGGASFSENDSNANSSSGLISYISPSQFNARLRSIAEDYPPMALKAMMNLEGSHDTNRVRFLLKKINNGNDRAAVQRMKEWWLFAFTYPGAPTLYYGDEIGLNHDGVWDGSTWQDDPYNRAPFPWPDATGGIYGYGAGNDTDDNAFDTGLQDFARQMASIRWSYRALQDGDVQHGLIIDDGNKLYGYARTNGSQTALIALNRDSTAHTATFSGLGVAPYALTDGTQLVNALTGDLATVYTVSGGQVTIDVTPTWGAVLLEKNKIETPAAVSDLSGSFADPNVTLTWSTVAADAAGNRELVTAYRIQRSTTSNFASYETVGTVGPSDETFCYGSGGGKFSYVDNIGSNVLYYYRVCPVNAAGVQGVCSAQVGPLAVTLADFSARQTSDGIVITWETASELNNRGFNLWRGTSEAGPDRKLNEDLIPSQSQGSPDGFVYTWEDRADLANGTTYWYWLEDLDVSGALTRHAPVSVDYVTPTAVGLAAFGARYDDGWAGLSDLRIAGLTALAAAALGWVAVRRRRMKDEG